MGGEGDAGEGAIKIKAQSLGPEKGITSLTRIECWIACHSITIRLVHGARHDPLGVDMVIGPNCRDEVSLGISVLLCCCVFVSLRCVAVSLCRCVVRLHPHHLNGWTRVRYTRTDILQRHSLIDHG